jgi:hypothetical protein
MKINPQWRGFVDWSMLLVAIGLTALIVVLA